MLLYHFTTTSILLSFYAHDCKGYKVNYTVYTVYVHVHVGYDTNKFCLHSFHAEGVTAAANAPGIHCTCATLQEAWAVEIRISQRWICEGLREQSPLGVKESGYLGSFYTAWLLSSLRQLFI